VIMADRAIYWLTAHWLLMVQCFLCAFIGMAFLSPVLTVHGHPRLGGAIFRAYGLVCHQRPERSFFVFGEQVAFCQRDVGTYGGLLIGGLLFAVSGRQLRLSNLRIYLVLFVLPLAIDGLTQLVGLRSSNWLLRLATGCWLGIGTGLLAYPIVNDAMAEVREELEGRLGPGLRWLTADSQGADYKEE